MTQTIKIRRFDGGEVERYFHEGKIKEIADYRESDMLLSGSVSGLQQQGFPVLAAMVAVFTLAAPTLLISEMTIGGA